MQEVEPSFDANKPESRRWKITCESLFLSDFRLQYCKHVFHIFELGFEVNLCVFSLHIDFLSLIYNTGMTFR